LADLDTYSRRLAKEGWERYFEGKADENMGFVFTDGEIAANSAANGRTKMESDKGVVKPVLIRGEYVGQVMVSDVDMDESETDMIMEAIAQGLGAHLENLRLNEQTELALAESRVRSEELNILNQLGADMAAALDVEDILKLIYRFTARLLDAANFYIALYDRNNEETAIYLFYTLDEDESRAARGDVRSILRRKGGNGVTEYILRSRQPLLISGNMEEKAVQLGFESIGKPSKSWLGVPMVAGNEAIGVIAVQSFDEEGVYGDHHLDLLTAVARQAAGAVENARLIAQTQARARQEQILREITARVYAAPDAESILKTAAQEVSRVLGIETYAYLDEGQTAVKQSGQNGH
jgi:GAF domain-containing protein